MKKLFTILVVSVLCSIGCDKTEPLPVRKHKRIKKQEPKIEVPVIQKTEPIIKPTTPIVKKPVQIVKKRKVRRRRKKTRRIIIVPRINTKSVSNSKATNKSRIEVRNNNKNVAKNNVVIYNIIKVPPPAPAQPKPTVRREPNEIIELHRPVPPPPPIFPGPPVVFEVRPLW